MKRNDGPRRASRRDFLRVSGGTLLTAGLFGGLLSRFATLDALAAGPGEYRALVCVFMFGGNDANNMVVPMDSGPYENYRSLRGRLALPPARLRAIGASAGAFGLHESLAPLAALYGQGHAAFVANMGTLVRPTTRQQVRDGSAQLPMQLFSHEDQILQMQAGFPSASSTGWGGRVVDRVRGENAQDFPAALSMNGAALFCQGAETMGASLGDGSSLGLKALDPPNAADAAARQDAYAAVLRMDSGMVLAGATNGVMTRARELQRLLETAQPPTAITTAFPATGLGRQLADVIRFVQLHDTFGLNRQVFFCGIGGFDTHSDQDPQHTGLLAEIAGAMTAFYHATVELGLADKITAFTESDFNRTLNPNGDGTDHAWGSHHLVVGGAVRGGEMYGRFPTLALQGPDDAGNRGVFIPTTALDQYGATLASWFGVADADLDAVFPHLVNFGVRNLGFMR